MTSLLSEMNQESFESVDKRVFILPVGSVEPHGAHLPLCTDTIIADELAKTVSDRTEWTVLPAIQYGFIYGLREFPGSISLREELLQSTIIEIAKELVKWGTEFLAVINCHIPNSAPINHALFKLLTDHGIKGINLTFPGYQEAYSKFCQSKLWKPGIFHADELETSIMLYLRKDLVNMEKAVKNYPDAPSSFGFYPYSWKTFSKVSLVGDPTLATEEKGEKLFNFFANKIIDLAVDARKRLTNSL